jgi:hypothetical protein
MERKLVSNIEGEPSCDQQAIADAFNNYFLSTAYKITKNDTHNKVGTNKDITSSPIYFLS